MPLNDVTIATVGVYNQQQQHHQQQQQQQQHDITAPNPASMGTSDEILRTKIQQQQKMEHDRQHRQQQKQSSPPTLSPEHKLNDTTKRLLAALACDELAMPQQADEDEAHSLDSVVDQLVSPQSQSDDDGSQLVGVATRPLGAINVGSGAGIKIGVTTDLRETNIKKNNEKNDFTNRNLENGTQVIHQNDQALRDRSRLSEPKVIKSSSPSSKENAMPPSVRALTKLKPNNTADISENQTASAGIKTRSTTSGSSGGSPRSLPTSVSTTRHKKHLSRGVLPRRVLSPKSKSLAASVDRQAPSSGSSGGLRSSVDGYTSTSKSKSIDPSDHFIIQQQNENDMTVSEPTTFAKVPSSVTKTKLARNRTSASKTNNFAATAAATIPSRRISKRVRFSSELSSARLFLDNETPKTIATTAPLRRSELRAAAAAKAYNSEGLIARTATAVDGNEKKRSRWNRHLNWPGKLGCNISASQPPRETQLQAVLGVLRWSLLVGLWVIAIVDPQMVVRGFDSVRMWWTPSTAVVAAGPAVDVGSRSTHGSNTDMNSQQQDGSEGDQPITMDQQQQWHRYLQQQYPYPPPPPQYMYPMPPQYHPNLRAQYQYQQYAADHTVRPPQANEAQEAAHNNQEHKRANFRSEGVPTNKSPPAIINGEAEEQTDESRANLRRIRQAQEVTSKLKRERNRRGVGYVPTGPAAVAIAWPVPGALVFGSRVDVRIAHSNLDIKRFALHRGAKVCLSLRSGAHHEMVGCVVVDADADSIGSKEGGDRDKKIEPKQYTDVKLDNLVDGEYELSAILLSDVRKLSRAVTKFEVRLLVDKPNTQGVHAAAVHVKSTSNGSIEGSNRRPSKRAAAAGTVGRHGGRVTERSRGIGTQGALGHMAMSAQGMQASADSHAAKVATRSHEEEVYAPPAEQKSSGSVCTTTCRTSCDE